jgi:MATE family multidrug resistance protein
MTVMKAITTSMSLTSQSTKLTPHPAGSLMELWTFALPLMLSSMSFLSMLFVDRLLLAYYSAEALNASASAATLGWAFVFGWFVLAGISEVFVAQYNGAGNQQQLGIPVWQMIWLSIGSAAFFVPLALWGTDWIYPPALRPLEGKYFYWMILTAPASPLYAALSGFFIGQGKTIILTLIALATNIVNGVLDLLLIFGVDGYIPEMGVEGAAISTTGSLGFQCLALLTLFLSKHNRQQFGTGSYGLCGETFRKCLKVGLPGAIFVCIEMFGWATYYELMAARGKSYILVASICQSLFFFLFFFAEGMGKAATALAGNHIGAHHPSLVSKLLLAGVRLHALFFLFGLFLFALAGDTFILHFTKDLSIDERSELYSILSIGMVCTLVTVLFEGIRLLICGILTAAGDTLFLMIAGSLSVWCILIAPVYLLLIKAQAPILVALICCMVYSLTAGIIYYCRFMSGKWKAENVLA